jgi:hypothetical protein
MGCDAQILEDVSKKVFKKKYGVVINKMIETPTGTICVELTEHTFIRSQRGAPLLLYQEHVYRCERVRDGRSYWLCIHYKHTKCNGRLILQGNNLVKENPHNHPISDKRIEKFRIERKSLGNLKEATEWLLNFKPNFKPKSLKKEKDPLRVIVEANKI